MVFRSMLLDYLKTQIKNQSTHNDYLIAYSGGLDSHVLLHLMVELRQQLPALKLQVVHIHHGLSPYDRNGPIIVKTFVLYYK